MKISPHNFRSITAYRLAQAQHAEAIDFWRKFRRWLLACVCVVSFILALIHFPAYVLAGLCILGSAAFLVAGWWLVECGLEDRNYDEDHDLP